MGEEIKFSTDERRIFELGFDKAITGPEAIALRKLLDNIPFLTQVAECKFDPKVSNAALVLYYAELGFKKACEEYFKNE